MDALRGFAGQNRGSIVNVVYIIAFVIVIYYLYKFLMSGSDLEVDLLNIEKPANESSTFPLPAGSTDLRIKTGGGYTISWWMYINSWDHRAGRAKSVLQVLDQTMPGNYLFTSMLYPNEAKMMIRIHTGATVSGETDYTAVSNFNTLMQNGTGATTSIEMPICDLQDIDLQRWINITATVNGRIVDVYYDGKLTRSCILPDIPKASESGAQAVVVGNSGGYGGKVSGIQFMAYPLTPDRIYAIYQAGPRGAAGFLGYIAEKMGIKLTYSGKGGASKSVSA